jgi:hypothetical protein
MELQVEEQEIELAPQEDTGAGNSFGTTTSTKFQHSPEPNLPVLEGEGSATPSHIDI